MKKFVLALLLVVVSSTFAPAADAPKVSDQSKHELTMVVVFNSVTLEQAVDLEKKIKAAFGDACKITIRLEPVGSREMTTNWYITPENVIKFNNGTTILKN